MQGKRNQVALVACSNGLSMASSQQVEQLQALLTSHQLEVHLSPYLYRGETAWSGTAKERADYLMASYRNADIMAIFDLSGGDLANELLPFLDFEVIGAHHKPLAGYSDLTTLLNAVYQKTKKPTLLYQGRHLVGRDALTQQRYLEGVLSGDSQTPVRVELLQGQQLSGLVVGGNIRCFLKLAGTPYFPDCHRKVLVLESLSGSLERIVTYLAQLQQMGVFEQVSGLLLGTFTELDEQGQRQAFLERVQAMVPDSLPIGQTLDIGHGVEARPIWIGRELVIEREDEDGD